MLECMSNKIKKQPLALKSLGKTPEVRYEKSVPSQGRVRS